jgi:hypothetical protein
LGDDASQPSQAAQNMPQTAELRLLARLDERMAAIQAQLDRQARVRELLDDAGYPPEPPRRPPRHAAPKRDRSHLRVIPGGMAALVPLILPGHGAPGLLPVMGHVWLGRRPWAVRARWVMAAAALGLAGATVPATAADGPPAHHAPALSCHDPRPYHPYRRDGDRDDKTVVALLPAACPAAGEGTAGHLPRQQP